MIGDRVSDLPCGLWDLLVYHSEATAVEGEECKRQMDAGCRSKDVHSQQSSWSRGRSSSAQQSSRTLTLPLSAALVA
jgi:hypothetical protein